MSKPGILKLYGTEKGLLKFNRVKGMSKLIYEYHLLSRLEALCLPKPRYEGHDTWTYYVLEGADGRTVKVYA